MKYCKDCGRFFVEGHMVDDGLKDDRFPDANGNRVYYEVCPACGRDNIEELFDDYYIVANSTADIAHVCFDVFDIPTGISILMEHGVDIDDVQVYAADDMEDGDEFGRLV